MSFYEWGLKALPEGSDSPSRLGLAAKRLGYDGIIICNSDPGNIFKPDGASMINGIDVSFGAEVTAINPRALRGHVAALRARYPFIVVHGGSEEMNRVACENPEVDVLVHPEGGRQGLGIAAARAARLNQVAIGFDLSPMVRLHGSSRSRWLEVSRRNLELVRKFNLSIMITVKAMSHLDLRAPRDLQALAEVAGFESAEAKEALSLPARILELNKRSWVSPGVEVL